MYIFIYTAYHIYHTDTHEDKLWEILPANVARYRLPGSLHFGNHAAVICKSRCSSEDPTQCWPSSSKWVRGYPAFALKGQLIPINFAIDMVELLGRGNFLFWTMAKWGCLEKVYIYIYTYISTVSYLFWCLLVGGLNPSEKY